LILYLNVGQIVLHKCSSIDILKPTRNHRSDINLLKKNWRIYVYRERTFIHYRRL